MCASYLVQYEEKEERATMCTVCIIQMLYCPYMNHFVRFMLYVSLPYVRVEVMLRTVWWTIAVFSTTKKEITDLFVSSELPEQKHFRLQLQLFVLDLFSVYSSL